MAEHGEEAAIAQVNRIRSGGVAGFFCREEFEVVVDPDAPRDPDDSIDLDGSDGPDGSSEPVDPDDEPNDEPNAEPVDPVDEPDDPDDETIGEALRRRDRETIPSRLAYKDLTEDPEPVPFASEPNEGADEDQTVFGGPVPPGSDPRRDKFLALLERRLDETSAVESDLQLRRSRSGPADGQQLAPALASVAPAPSPLPMAPEPNLAPEPSRPPEPNPNPAREVTRRVTPAQRPRPVFWRRLDRASAELASFLPAGSPVTAVVGPLALATTVAHRLQSSVELASADVIVLTDRAGIVSEPSWHLVRNGDRLVRLLADRDGRPTIVIIDVPVELPHWVVPLQRRLRSVGVGLFHYAVDGQPSGTELERYRQGADVPYAIDLSARVEPALVAELVADRHPIVSVAGTGIGPELLLAIRRHSAAAELLFEPVIDG